MSHAELQSLPKVELHLHLDCSLSYSVVRRIAPRISHEEYRRTFVAPAKCADLVDYISRAVRGFELMQTVEQLRLVTVDLFEQLKADNVVYAEIRFAPLLHTVGGLRPHQVVEAVDKAVDEASKRYGVEAGLILCTLRHYSEDESRTTARLAAEFAGSHVVGFDIAADEAGFPIDNHVSAFRMAGEKGVLCTAHAGEARGPDSVWETLEHFRPRRIGHGVRSAEDPRLLDHLREHRIHLEVCPTSNVQTNVFDTIRQHAADRLYRAGVSISINTDARTISDTTLTGEYALMEREFGWTKEQLRVCNLQALEHAFAADPIKARIRSTIEGAYGL